MALKRIPLLVAASLATLALTGCANNFRANVSRFQQMPPNQGQTFVVKADNPQLSGSLEFSHYADLVGERLVANGYRPATDPTSAQLIIHMGYSIDRGREVVRTTGFRDPFYDPFYPGYSGWGPGWRGWRGRYVYGFYDPFMWGPGYSGVESYTVYSTQLKLSIDQAGGPRVFEGTAKAQSVSNKLTYLVPNLIDAMFTGFPGNNGEEIKVTVAPEPKGK